jgi:hypothetical protein
VYAVTPWSPRVVRVCERTGLQVPPIPFVLFRPCNFSTGCEPWSQSSSFALKRGRARLSWSSGDPAACLFIYLRREGHRSRTNLRAELSGVPGTVSLALSVFSTCLAQGCSQSSKLRVFFFFPSLTGNEVSSTFRTNEAGLSWSARLTKLKAYFVLETH